MFPDCQVTNNSSQQQKKSIFPISLKSTQVHDKKITQWYNIWYSLSHGDSILETPYDKQNICVYLWESMHSKFP